MNENALKSEFFGNKAITTLLILLLGGCASSTEDKLIIYLAASTQDVLEVLTREYQGSSELEFTFVPASSGTLARQITSGAHFDLFLSANPTWMAQVAEEGLCSPPQDLVSNAMVLVGTKGAAPLTLDLFEDQQEFKNWLGDKKISIGDPDHVPSGVYGKQILESLGLWNTLHSSLHLTMDARSALSVVELGEIDYGIVYSTEANLTQTVEIFGTFPPQYHERISYQICLSDANDPQASDFYQYLRGPSAQNIWQEHGFLPLEATQ